MAKDYKKIESRIGIIKFWNNKRWIATPNERENSLFVDWQPLDSFCRYCNKKLEHDANWQAFPILRTICDNCDDIMSRGSGITSGMDE